MSNLKCKNNQRNYLIDSPVYLTDNSRKPLIELQNMKIMPVFLWVIKCNKVNKMRKFAKNALGYAMIV